MIGSIEVVKGASRLGSAEGLSITSTVNGIGKGRVSSDQYQGLHDFEVYICSICTDGDMSYRVCGMWYMGHGIWYTEHNHYSLEACIIQH